MASLLAEYRERHGLKCVFPLDEGMCFFDVNKKPGAVVLTSSHSRSAINCHNCLTPKNGLIGEIFILTNSLKIEKHEHISPDTDLYEWVNNNISKKEGNYEPYVAESIQDVECWLWRFFTKHNNILPIRKWHNKEEPFRSIEQMLWAIRENQLLFGSFYKNVYNPIMLGRKYILY
jgi:hypothetical protein